MSVFVMKQRCFFSMEAHPILLRFLRRTENLVQNIILYKSNTWVKDNPDEKYRQDYFLLYS